MLSLVFYCTSSMMCTAFLLLVVGGKLKQRHSGYVAEVRLFFLPKRVN